MGFLDKLMGNEAKTPDMVFQIGDEVKDSITGFSGVVVYYAKYLYNCDRAGVQPRELKDGEPAEMKHFDVPQLSLVATAVVPATPLAPHSLTLGDTVRDTITGLEGIVVGFGYWLNGCVRVGVQPKQLKDGVPVEDTWFPAAQLEPVIKNPDPPSKSYTGGPMPAPKQMRNPR